MKPRAGGAREPPKVASCATRSRRPWGRRDAKLMCRTASFSALLFSKFARFVGRFAAGAGCRWRGPPRSIARAAVGARPARGKGRRAGVLLSRLAVGTIGRSRPVLRRELARRVQLPIKKVPNDQDSQRRGPRYHRGCGLDAILHGGLSRKCPSISVALPMYPPASGHDEASPSRSEPRIGVGADNGRCGAEARRFSPTPASSMRSTATLQPFAPSSRAALPHWSSPKSRSQTAKCAPCSMS